MFRIWFKLLGVISFLTIWTMAGISTKCPRTDICFSLNIPDKTSSSGNGVVYIQVAAPTKYTWVSLAQGSQMSGANFFVVYANLEGNNVTISPRLTNGHSMPTYNAAAQITLIEGSGVSDGIMTANFKCLNCNSWSGGSMDFTASSTSWIYAYLSGNELKSNSQTVSISRHSSYGAMSFDSTAQGGSDANPFLNVTRTGSACISPTSSSTSNGLSSFASGNVFSGIPNWFGSAVRSYSPDAYEQNRKSARESQPVTAQDLVKRVTSDCNSNGYQSQSGGITDDSQDDSDRKRTIHGIVAATSFCILFPLGGIMIRLFSFRGLVWLHGVWQTISYLMFVGAAVLGIQLAKHYVSYVFLLYSTEYQVILYQTNFGKYRLTEPHMIIGLTLLCAMLLQAPFGYLHHRAYVLTKDRTIWSHAHLWIGRLAIPLGVVNSVLGIEIAGGAQWLMITVGLIGGGLTLLYLICMLFGEWKRQRK